MARSCAGGLPGQNLECAAYKLTLNNDDAPALPVDIQRSAFQQGLPEEAPEPASHLQPEQEGRQDGEGFHASPRVAMR